MATKVTMPEMGEGVIEGTISRWLKNEGDTIRQYEPIMEIETDKVTTEATAEEAGTLLKIMVPEGETVPVGTILAYVGDPEERIPETSDETVKDAKASSAVAKSATEKSKSANGRPGPSKPYTGRLSPVVGRIAGEHNVDLGRVKGSGRDGRITKKDILTYIEARDAEPAASAEPTPAPPPPATEEAAEAPAAGKTIPLTNMRRAIAEHMVRSKSTSPHVTTVFEFDFSAVFAHRAAHKAQFAQDGADLTYTAYIVAATVRALKANPLVNSIWSEEGIVLKRDINVGVATAIDDGLIVPVLKNADSLNLLGVARGVNDLAKRARNKGLSPGDVQGGTFSITNHGVFGSILGTPIINQPQCGILGVGKIEKRVKVIDDAIAIRPLAYVSFTFDHRILDGATADKFVNSIKETVENWR